MEKEGKKLDFQKKTSRRKKGTPEILKVDQPKPQKIGVFGRQILLAAAGLTGNTLGMVHFLLALLCIKDAMGRSRAFFGIEFERRQQFEGIGWHLFWLRLGYSRPLGGKWERFKGI